MHQFGITLQIRRQINRRSLNFLGNELFFNKILCAGCSSKKLSSIVKDMELDKNAVNDKRQKTNRKVDNFINSVSTKFMKSEKKNAGSYLLYIPGSGAIGTSKSLFLRTGRGSYLFNCGEDASKIDHISAAGGKEVKNIFISQLVWENLGGLSGAMKKLLNSRELKLQSNVEVDDSKPVFTLYGPPGLKQLFEVLGCLIDLRDHEIKIVDTTKDQSFDDGVLHINYVPLYPTEKSSNDNIFGKKAAEEKPKLDLDGMIDAFLCYDYYGFPQKKGYKERMRLKDIKCLAETDDRTRRASICYVCRTQVDEKKHLNLEACVDMGVPPSLLGKLKNEEDVTLPNGNVVRFEDVCFPVLTDKTFVVVDCPGEEYLSSLLENPVFKKLQTTTIQEEKPVVIVHFSPPSVMNHPEYVNWMENFSPTTKHIRVNEENICTGNLLNHEFQTKLNLIHDQIFPVLPNPAIPVVKLPEYLEKNKQSPLFKVEKRLLELETKIKWEPLENIEKKILEGGSKIVINLKNCSIGSNPSFNICPEGYLHDALAEEGVEETLKNLKEEINEMESVIKSTSEGDYPRFLFLGTGSSCPQNFRNVSGILVFTQEDTCMLMDCGGGTHNRINVFFGKEKADEILVKLKAVYISHMHADHHLGLIEIIKGRRRAIRDLLEKTKKNSEFENLSNQEIISKLNIKPLYLVGQFRLLEWLNFYDTYYEKINDDFNFIFIGTFQNLNRKEGKVNVAYTREGIVKTTSPETINSFLQDLHIQDFETCFVHHCFSSFGLSFKSNNGFKVSYSGDCTPTRAFMAMGRDSDLLIHEATFENYLAGLAKSKKHSTINEALFVGKKMRAKHILLTHFSQRYAYLPMNTETFPNNVGIAFDFMTVSMKQLLLLPKFLPAIRLIFADALRKMTDATVNRQLKEERERLEFFNKL